MSDGKWLLKQGFQVVDETETGFQLLAYILDEKAQNRALVSRPKLES